MRVERKVAARLWLAALMIPVLAVSVSGQAAPSSAQTPPRFEITAVLTPPQQPQQPPPTPPAGQAPPAGQKPPVGPTPPATAPPPPVSPTAPLATGQQPPTGEEVKPIQEERTNGPTRKITMEEAAELALENNLGVKIQRIQPAISDVAIKSARAAWLPTLNGDLSFQKSSSQPTTTLAGSTDTQETQNFAGSAGVAQNLPWYGTSFNVGFDASRYEQNNFFSNYNPRLSSSLAFNLTQPLLRNFKTDANRATYLVSKKNREISDVQLHQQIVQTTAQVRQAYWDLVYARANLSVLQSTLDLARQTLRDNRTRVEVGTMAPIDIVEAQAEVARNEQLVIGAAAQIDQAEDTLRALIFNPDQPEFWSLNIDLADQPDVPSSQADVDIEGAVRHAFDVRTDLIQMRKSLEASEINLRYYKNQILPQLNAVANYGLSAIGGVYTERAQNPDNPLLPGEITFQQSTSFNDTLRTLFGVNYPTWTVGINVAYPIGTSTQRANLMRAKLQYDSDKLNLQNQELIVGTQVRSAGRTLNTNRRQVEAARVSLELFQRRLEAAQKKFAVGLATSFEVLQAQRDLADAKNQELNAVINYVKSRVQFETVQEVGTSFSNANGTQGSGGTGSTGNTGSNGNTGTGSTGNTTGR